MTAAAPALEPPPQTAEALFSALLLMRPERLAHLLASDPDRAAPWVRAAAECGLVEAQVHYARLLLEGRGVKRNTAAAHGWFRRAAASGDADACNMVGRCLENGWGAVASASEAAPWYRRAAETGLAWAQYNLAHLLLDGNGVARDATAGFDLYRRAAAQGHARAMNLVGRCLEHGWGCACDPAEARRWYARSAAGGYFRGRFNHADCLAADGDLDGAVAMFDAAFASAPPQNRRGMAEALLTRDDPRLRALGHARLTGAPSCS